MHGDSTEWSFVHAVWRPDSSSQLLGRKQARRHKTLGRQRCRSPTGARLGLCRRELGCPLPLLAMAGGAEASRRVLLGGAESSGGGVRAPRRDQGLDGAESSGGGVHGPRRDQVMAKPVRRRVRRAQPAHGLVLSLNPDVVAQSSGSCRPFLSPRPYHSLGADPPPPRVAAAARQGHCRPRAAPQLPRKSHPSAGHVVSSPHLFLLWGTIL